MRDRRTFLKSIVPVAVAITLPKPAEASQDICQFYADQLGAAMKARHGGNWSVEVNHKTTCAIIARL
jgi:hypothetical protein